MRIESGSFFQVPDKALYIASDFGPLLFIVYCTMNRSDCTGHHYQLPGAENVHVRGILSGIFQRESAMGVSQLKYFQIYH